MSDEFKVEKNLIGIKNSKNNIILFGEVGCGKTTIINKICGVNFLVKEGGFSVTNEVQFAALDNNIIIDFPCFTSGEEAFKHLKEQKSTLSTIPARVICFVIKNERYDLIQKRIFKMLKIFCEHKENICLIITFSESLNIKEKSEIQNIIKTKFQMQNIVFSSQNISGDELLNQLKSHTRLFSNINSINFSERHLINSVGTEGICFEVIKIRDEYLQKYNKAIDLFRNEFSKASESSLKFALYYAFRDYKDNLIDAFSEEIKKRVIDKDNAIIEIITFNNELYEPFKRITELYESEMKTEYATFDNRNENKYKKCHICGRIWFRITGSNQIICGKRTKRKDIFCGKLKTYQVNFNGEIFKINLLKDNKEDLDSNASFFWLTEEERESNNKYREGKHQIIPEGCGSRLNWEMLEDVTNEVNQLLKKTYADKTYDLKMKEKLQSLNVDL